MRDGFESYRAELDGLRLTEESRERLADRLTGRRSLEADRRSHRPGGRLGRAAVIAAAACLLAAVGGAAVVSSVPTLRDRFFGGDSAGYRQSGGFVGRAVENNGWTLSITDCVGDDYYVYLGMELEAPEGTVLDAPDYRFARFSASFTDSSLYGTYDVMPLPDEDPTDNKLPLMWLLYSSQPGVNGSTVRLTVSDLGHRWDNGEAYQLDCGGTWDLGAVTVRYPDSVLRLTPGTPVEVPLEGPGGVRTLDAQVSRVEISPLALNVWISGEDLVLHHGPDRPQPSETFYFCDSTQEVLAFDADGQPIAMRAGMEGMGGGGCSGYNESEGYIWLSCGFGGLMDVNRVAKIVVNGVEIPVRP